GGQLLAQATRLRQATLEAYAMQYGDIFLATAVVCVIGALVGLLISGRKEHADEVEPSAGGGGGAPTDLIDAPTPGGRDRG
ncbi:hypothetical protein ABQE42_25450, partial [Mycolicibacterium pulveris]